MLLIESDRWWFFSLVQIKPRHTDSTGTRPELRWMLTLANAICIAVIPCINHKLRGSLCGRAITDFIIVCPGTQQAQNSFSTFCWCTNIRHILILWLSKHAHTEAAYGCEEWCAETPWGIKDIRCPCMYTEGEKPRRRITWQQAPFNCMYSCAQHAKESRVHAVT